MAKEIVMPSSVIGRTVVLFALALAGLSCGTPAGAGGAAVHELPKPAADLPAPAKAGETRTLVLAGGCFWCAEAVFEELKGVTDVTSGYAGGTAETATYEQVGAGGTGHAESIRITYDPSKITYADLLRVFFTVFDPTTLDRQGPDAGHQYRTAIFYENDDQKRVAEAYIKQLNDAKAFDAPIVTTLEPLKAFYPAEAYHQDFVRHHPDHPYVVQWSVPKQRKVRAAFPDLVKPAGK
jgi:peptide-methionine (S)-S-oxide reductase